MEKSPGAIDRVGPEQLLAQGAEFSLDFVGEKEYGPLRETGAVILNGAIERHVPITEHNQDFFWRDSQRGGIYRRTNQGSALIVSLIDQAVMSQNNSNDASDFRGMNILTKKDECIPFAYPLGINLIDYHSPIEQKHVSSMLVVDPEAQDINKRLFTIDEIAVVSASPYMLRFLASETKT